MQCFGRGTAMPQKKSLVIVISSSRAPQSPPPPPSKIIRSLLAAKGTTPANAGQCKQRQVRPLRPESTPKQEVPRQNRIVLRPVLGVRMRQNGRCVPQNMKHPQCAVLPRGNPMAPLFRHKPFARHKMWMAETAGGQYRNHRRYQGNYSPPPPPCGSFNVLVPQPATDGET